MAEYLIPLKIEKMEEGELTGLTIVAAKRFAEKTAAGGQKARPT